MKKRTPKERTPKVLTMSDVGERWGWPTWKVTRLLVKAGCTDDINQSDASSGKKRRCTYVTTRARVREKFPELARLL